METKRITIKKGLDLPLDGRPDQTVVDSKAASNVALLGSDYIGIKPHFAVTAGDRVKLGDILFYDKKMPALRFTSPGSGRVVEINRGERRKLLSVVIALEGNDETTFTSYANHNIPSLDRKDVISQLVQSGLWTAIRSRPFSRIADPDTTPRSLFITAMDTNPLAPSVEKIIAQKEDEFITGIKVLSRLTAGRLFLCKSPAQTVPAPELASLSVVEFSGPHPAGNAGTHIHMLDPAGRNNQVWQIDAQDVIAVGHLFTTGRISTERVISLAGPSVQTPRLIRTRIGASIEDIVSGELAAGEHRVISGSVLSGGSADKPAGYLGRYHRQITVLPEGGKRELFGWLAPGLHLFSVKNVVLSRLLQRRTFSFTTSSHGQRRAIMPIGAYEKVMPLDLLPTFLLKALAVDDIEEAERLGCLELDEEDLSLCSFVCPSKIDHGAALRRNLSMIEKEG